MNEEKAESEKKRKDEKAEKRWRRRIGIEGGVGGGEDMIREWLLAATWWA